MTRSASRWWTLLAVCGATFMLLVDVTIVQVALPTIQRHLQANFADLQWVIDAYALTLASLLLTAGSLADHVGRKRVFVGGLAVFSVASLLCGAATSSSLLIWARAVQGLGGAAMFATGLALIGQDYRGADRGKAIAVWGATVGGAVAVGPLIGGALTDGFGWRWIFFVNVPIGALTIAVSVAKMVNVRDPGARRLDVVGLVTFCASLFLLILALVRGNDDGWGSPRIASLFAAAAVLMVAFVVTERRHERAMFDLSLFRKPGFTGVSIATFAIGAGMFALLPYLTFYLQNDLGYSPLAGGLRLLPATVPAFVVPMATRRVADRLPPGLVLGTGLGVTAVGIALMHGLAVGSSWTALIPGLLVSGLGIGIANPAIARIALGVVEPQRSGMASGISNTFRIGGLATGVAALGAVFQHRLAGSLAAGLGHPAPALARAIASGGLRAAAAAPGAGGLVPAARRAFADATNELFAIGAVVVAAGALTAALLIRARDFHGASEPVQREEPVPVSGPSRRGL